MPHQRSSLDRISKCTFKFSKLFFTGFLTTILLCSLLPSDVKAQDAESKEEKAAKFASNLWDYLLSNNYKHWAPGPGKTVNLFSNQKANQPLSQGTSNPHGSYLKSYMNRKAAGSPENLPVGSIVILENYRPDKSLESISVMYRSPGFNPKANDWYWVKYNADGSVATELTQVMRASAMVDGDVNQSFASTSADGKVKLMGRASSCIACHQQSGGSDLAFFNDRFSGDVRGLTMSEEFGKK